MTRKTIRCCLLIAVILLTYYAVLTIFARNAQRNREYAIRMQESHDVADNDFAATIKPTNDPLEFIIEVSRVNNSVDKEIGQFPVVVNLVVAGKSSTAPAPAYPDMPERAWELDEGFSGNRHAGATSLQGRVRLIRRGLAPGVYSIKPYVRINEMGKDALRGPYTDMGSVQVKSLNSLSVELRKPWQVQPLTSPKDVSDRDFGASISPTSDPYIFEIDVKKVNPSAKKSINSHHEVFADLELVDSKGRTISGDFCIQTFAEYDGDGLLPNDEQLYPTHKKGKVRLITTGLDTEEYTIRPVVRITEGGRDRMLNKRAELASVAVPAVNSIKVTVK